MSQPESNEEFAARMGANIKARQEYPLDELYAKYADKCIAWGPDGKTIIASANDYDQLWAAVQALGVDPSRCIFDAVEWG